MRSMVGRYARPGVLRALLDQRQTGLGAVLRNVSTLSATTAVTSGLGFVFWSIAARSAPPAAVGLAAAAISASTLLATVSMLGLGTLLIGQVAAGADRHHSVLTTALLVVGSVSTVLGVGFALLGPNLVKELGPEIFGLSFVVLFAVTCATTAIGQLIDQVMVGLLRSELQLARNSLFSLAKLGALVLVAPLLGRDNGLLVFGVWPLGNAISLVALCLFVLWRPVGISLGRPQWQLVRRMGGAALSHHALNLSAQVAGLLLPVLVTVLLSATANAYFYTGWMIATVAFVPLNALSVTLFALGARDPGALRSRARLTLLLGLLEGLAAVGVVELLAPWLLSGFGKTYAVEASLSLRILIIAVLPTVIKVHFISLSRVTGRVRSGSLYMAAGACFELAAATLGGYLGGLPGLSLGWLIGITIEAGLMLPRVWRVVAPSPAAAQKVRRFFSIATDA
jgi:O-antigen/teichoic acid export membrane protein